MTKLHFLTSLSFGVHSPRRCPYRALLSDHENKRFVIFVLRDDPHQVDGRFGKAVQQIVSKIWDKNNPFSWGDDSPGHRVVALEVEWSTIVGIDYRCPLHDDGKLVLEARQVVKRCFKTVEDARDFYSPRIVGLRTGPLRPSYSAAPTPSKVSLDGRHALISSTSTAQLGSSVALLPLSPLSSRPISCGSTIRTGMQSLPMASTDVCDGAVGVINGTAAAAGDGFGVGRRTALFSFRPCLDPAPFWSVSATRVPRASAVTSHVGCTIGTRTSSFHSSSCMDFASADEGEGCSRHRRVSGMVSATVATPDGLGSGVIPARRRLKLHATDAVPCPVQEMVPRDGAVGDGLRGAREPVHKYFDGTNRKARSVNDLCGLAGAQEDSQCGDQVTTATAADASTGSICWSASASGARSAGSQRRDAACDEGVDCGRFITSRRDAGTVDGVTVGCSSTVYSLTAAFFSKQQEQQLVNNEFRSRQRRGGNRVRREHASCTQLPDACPEGGGSGEAFVPRASRFTQPSATYCYNTLVLGFRDPFLPQELRRFVKSDMRLLKLYESGLPAWAVFMPCYGLPYRPWLRRALWLLFIAISIFSMGCGFYDLYKNVPFLKQVITAVASRMYLPASELFEWLERHTQIRMSILLTYLFSKSPLFLSMMRMLRSLAALLQQVLQPVMAGISAAMQPLIAALQVAATAVGGSVTGAATAVWGAARPTLSLVVSSGKEVIEFAAAVLGPPARGLWAVAVLLAQLIRLVAALIGMVLVGPLQLACSIGGVLSWAGAELAEQLAVAAEAAMAVLRWIVTLGRAARTAAPAVKAGVRFAAQAAGVTGGGGGGTGGFSGGMAVWQWLGLEVVGAYNAVRMTFVQAFKSAQAVMNFCVTVAQTAVQHRVSLLLQLRRFITRQKERLPPAVAASVPLPSFVSMPSFTSLSPYNIPLPGSDHDTDLDQEADLETEMAASKVEHALYGLDMVHVGSSDDESHLLAPNPSILYGDGSGMAGHRDVCRLAEPITIPLHGHGGGLRRRHRGSAVSSRLGGNDGRSGNVRYTVYDVPRRTLDAVDEEEMEDAQQLSDRDCLGAETRRSKVDGSAVHGLRHLQSVSFGTRDETRDVNGNLWMGQVDVLGPAEEAGSGGSDFLRCTSAPSGSNGSYEGISHATYGVQSSVSSPSRRRSRRLQHASISRSVPSAGQMGGRQLATGSEPVSSMQHRVPSYPQVQEQQLCGSGNLGCSALSPPIDSSVIRAAERDAGGNSRGCKLRRRKGGGSPRTTASTIATEAVASCGTATQLPSFGASASGADALTLSSAFVRDVRGAQALAVLNAVPSCSQTTGGGSAAAAAGPNIAAAAKGGKAAASGNAKRHDKGRGTGTGNGSNNACGKPASRQTAIQTA